MQDPVHLRVGNMRSNGALSLVHSLTVPTVSFLLLLRPGPLTLTNCFASRAVAVGLASQGPRPSDNPCQSVCLSPFSRASFTTVPSPTPGSAVPHLNGSFFFSSGPVAPGSSLQTLKLSFIFSSTRLSEPTVPVSQAKSHRDNVGQDTLSVGLVGCRRDEDVGGAVAPFGPPYRALYL